MTPTYEQAYQWALEKCKHAHDSGCGYVAIQKRSDCEIGYMLVRRHKAKQSGIVPRCGTLEDWAKAIAQQLVAQGLCLPPTEAK